MTLRSRPDRLALRNDFSAFFDAMTAGGVLSDALALRAFIAAERDDDEPIDPALQAEGDAQGGGTGDYIATIPGAVTNEHLRPDYLYRTVWIVGESVPPGSYRDAYAVRVVEDQSD